MKTLVLNGPSLNLLGTREPKTYGTQTLADLDGLVSKWGEALDITVETLQSNHEGVLIDAIHGTDADSIVINPAAYTHTSRAIGDAITARGLPAVEVHISNIKEREPWRAESFVSDSCVRTIYGRGIVGYQHALRHLKNRTLTPFSRVSYGDHPDNVGELRGTGSRLFVILHGGFWRREWTSDTTESLAVDLALRGHTSWNVEYRRLGEGGGWPESFDDVLDALKFVPQLDGSFETVTIVGHSAGGHMGLWAAPRSEIVVDRVIALAPGTDLAALAALGEIGADECRQLLDAGADPTPDPGAIPTTVVHGTEDNHVPHSQSVDYVANTGVEFISLETGHFQLLDPSQKYWTDLIAGI